DLAERLAAPPDAEAVAQVTVFHVALRVGNVTYHGQKTHDKKIVEYLKKAKSCSFSSEQYQLVLEALLAMRARAPAQTYAQQARRAFPTEPFFFLAEAEAEGNWETGRVAAWKIRPLLDKAEKLAQALPPEDPRRDDLLARIRERLEDLQELNPFTGGFLADLF